jgi:hypothetical protein
MQLQRPNVSWGCDPEAFFQREGQIIGSERVIPRKGMRFPWGKIVRDGVQFEFNPRAGHDLLHYMSALIVGLSRELEKHPDVTICYDGLVEVSETELDQLSIESKVLGCMPSYNFYGVQPITVDPLTYRKRSSGGHIHMGLPYTLMAHRQNLVPLCDIFIGNTAVLLDRDPGAAERRENYGRAGEYRLPRHGLEYRTPSNFWLRAPELLDLMLGMSSFVVAVGEEIYLNGNSKLEDELIALVSLQRVTQAINFNDHALATVNFEAIRPFLAKYLPTQGFGLTPDHIDQFLTLSDFTKQVGLHAVFPTENLVERWMNPNRTFTDFLDLV